MDSNSLSGPFQKRLHLIPATYPRHPLTVIDARVQLRLAVYEYWLRTSSDATFTLIFTHGTSFNKDLWDMAIERLLFHPEIAFRTARILAIDAATHGDSAVFNRDALGETSQLPLQHLSHKVEVY